MEEFYDSIKLEFEHSFSFLEDKPEETVDSTLKALWHKAHGTPVSAERANILPLPNLSSSQKSVLLQLIEKRINEMPLPHLTGRQSFMGIELKCDARALIPRKETEILGQTALEICRKWADKKQKVNVLDVCCGSGNLGLAIATFESDAIVYLSDICPDAIELAKENITFLNLRKRVKATQSDLFASFDSARFWGNMDMIVCNPPYITSAKVSKMNSQIISHEPLKAFDGGIIGIKIIQKLIQEAPKFLSKGGWLIFEVGLGQGQFIVKMCEKSGSWEYIKPSEDASDNIRVIALRYKKN